VARLVICFLYEIDPRVKRIRISALSRLDESFIRERRREREGERERESERERERERGSLMRDTFRAFKRPIEIVERDITSRV